ncbi:Ferrichrome receptor FcuA precursor [compost metagenome]
MPKQVLRAQAAYRFASVPGLELAGQLSYEGRRNVLPDGSIRLPSWTRLDAVLRYDTKLAGMATSWTLAVDNLFDRRYWKESPYQFSHVYLFPGAPRTLRLGVSIAM